MDEKEAEKSVHLEMRNLNEHAQYKRGVVLPENGVRKHSLGTLFLSHSIRAQIQKHGAIYGH